MLFIFDIGGVLTNTSNEKDKIAKAIGISLEKYKEYTSDLYDDDSLQPQEFWRVFNQRSGLDVKVDWIHFFFHPKLNMETVALIEKLKKAGHRVVAGTNTCFSHYQNHIERGDYVYFDQTYASVFMGTHKPDLDFWKIILKAEGDVNPKDCVFIDDRIENCDAARKLGINAINFISVDQVEHEVSLLTNI